jgi:signal recognition particle receptor subunit alpha
VSLYGDQLTRPNTTIVECVKFDEYFDQQLQELEQGSGKSDTRAFKVDIIAEDKPTSTPTLAHSRNPNEASPDSMPIATPNASRPSTPSPGHRLVAKPGPGGKLSRRARKMQNNNSAPVSSGDEGSGRKTKVAKPVKRGRKWDADGLADETDDVQLDYSVPALTSDSEVEAGGKPGAVEEVDASTWGSRTKGKFVLKELGDEVHSILADADARKNADAKTESPSGLVGSGLSAISGLFRNVVGGKVLTKQDLEKAMKGMEEHLLKKNVAREAAVRLCEGVEKELVGVKTGSFESAFILLPTVYLRKIAANLLFARHQHQDTKSHGSVPHENADADLLARSPARDRLHRIPAGNLPPEAAAVRHVHCGSQWRGQVDQPVQDLLLPPPEPVQSAHCRRRHFPVRCR